MDAARLVPLVDKVRQRHTDSIGVIPDFGNVIATPERDRYVQICDMAPYAVLVHPKMHDFDDNGDQPEWDTARLVKTLLTPVFGPVDRRVRKAISTRPRPGSKKLPPPEPLLYAIGEHMEHAIAFVSKETAALVDVDPPGPPAPNEILGRTLFTLVSPGTELNWQYRGSSFPLIPAMPVYAKQSKSEAMLRVYRGARRSFAWGAPQLPEDRIGCGVASARRPGSFPGQRWRA